MGAQAREPLAPKQGWYCTVCGARYKTTNGVLVEFREGETLSYARADFPPDCMQQVKWTSIQREYKSTDPEELLQMIPEAKVLPSGCIRAVDGKEGTFWYDAEKLDQMAWMDWSLLLNKDLLQGATSK